MLSTLNSAQTRPTVTPADGELARVLDAYAAAAAEYHRDSRCPRGGA